MDIAQAAPVEGKQAPWGFWPTIGFSVAVILVYFAVSVLIVIAFAIAFVLANPNADVDEFLTTAATNGLIAFLGIAIAAPLCAGLVLWFVRLKATLSVKDYLCLVPVSAKTALIWFALLALLLIASDLLTSLLDRPISGEIMVEYYRTSQVVVLSWFAVLIAGPIFEEVLFRGFMFRGIQASALGNGGAILITASTWAAIHVQYDAYLMATIFVLGVVFGAARAATGSLYLTTAMHVVTNLIATVQIHLFTGS